MSEINRKYPKVLLWGHTFDNYSGMGITLTNIFYNWPTERIAVSANGVNKTLCEEIRPCATYIPWSNGASISKRDKKRTKSDAVKDILRPIVKMFDFREILRKPNISNRVVEEIKQYSPDVIFCSLGSLASMKLLLELNRLLPNIPIVLYIVDDWPNTRYLDKRFRFVWKRQYKKYFSKVLNIAQGYYSICKYMSDAYLEQYGKKFYPVHNPVDVEYWNSIETEAKYDVPSILYVGKINRETADNIHDMCRVVECLNKQGIKVVFDVYSPDYASKGHKFSKYKNSHILPAVDHDQIPLLTKQYKYLFLTLGFSKVSRKYARLSMPTKLSEYMASGCPTILYSPKDIALSKYVAEHNAALTCFERDVDALYDKLLLLITDGHISEMVKENACKLAKQHDIYSVRTDFENSLIDTLKV